MIGLSTDRKKETVLRTFSPQIVLRATTTGSAPDARTRSKQRGIPVLV